MIRSRMKSRFLRAFRLTIAEEGSCQSMVYRSVTKHMESLSDILSYAYTFSENGFTGKLHFLDKSIKYPFNMLLNFIFKTNKH